MTKRHFTGCVIGAILLACHSGCQQSELRARVEHIESRVNSQPEKPVAQPQPAAPAPILGGAPMRYTALSLDDVERGFSNDMALLNANVGAPFRSERVENGAVKLSVPDSTLGFGRFALALLEKHGFKQVEGADRSRRWSGIFSENELSELEQAAQALLESTSQTAANIAPMMMKRYPTHRTVNHSRVVPGQLVYTGNSQDITLPVGNGNTFIEAHKNKDSETGKQYLRCGRLDVNTEGQLRLDGFVLPGLKALPAGSPAPTVFPDGRIATLQNGQLMELGRLKVVKIAEAHAEIGGQFRPAEGNVPEVIASSEASALIMPGHLELNDESWNLKAFRDAAQSRNTMVALLAGTKNLATAPQAQPGDVVRLPLIFHAPAAKTAEHLKALGVDVEGTNERTSIGQRSSCEALTLNFIQVLNGFRKRIAVHEENLLNVGKTRDGDGRLNPYRRKTVEIGPKGELIDGTDKSELPRNYKPGDPDAGQDGFVVLSNVNKTVEMAELKAVIEEYRMVREALLRLDPRQIFPDMLSR